LPEPEVETGAPRTEREIADELRLRPTLPGVTRLSRKVLIGLGAVASIGVGGALMLGLQSRDAGDEPSELYNTDRVAQADGLGNLPRDYSGLPKDVPQLGPPLPGDMGRPMLSGSGARTSCSDAACAGGSPSARRARSRCPAGRSRRSASDPGTRAARTSQLVQRRAGRRRSGPAARRAQVGRSAAQGSVQPLGRGEAFLAARRRSAHRQPRSHCPPASPYVLQAGA
jgi:type IV secretion system protein VirB10